MDNSSHDIINRIRKSDHKTFETLFKSYYARLCEFSFLITKDKEASVDIVQDFFVKLWENRTKLKINNLKSYMFKSVHNNSVKHMGKTLQFESFGENKTNNYGFSVPKDFELKEKLEKSLNELPPRCREVFILSRIDKLHHKEIAEKLGISTKTVEVQIRKASIFLKEKLKEFYFLLIFLFFV